MTSVPRSPSGPASSGAPTPRRPAAPATSAGRFQRTVRQSRGRGEQRGSTGAVWNHAARARTAYMDDADVLARFCPHRQQAGGAFLHQCTLVRSRHARIERCPRRAHAAMARERQLLARSEDAHAVVGARLRGRQEEHGFRQVGSLRVGLHGCAVHAGRVEHHAKRIAGAWAIGEHVQLQVAAGAEWGGRS